MIGEKWMLFAIGEGGAKTASKMLQKVIGKASLTWGYVFFASLVVELIKVVSGFCISKSRGKSLIGDRRLAIGACWAGFFGFVSTILSFGVFTFNADIGVNTFIITCSIIPGALIDRFYFSHGLRRRQWFGIAVAIFAGYAVLGWPPLSKLLTLPVWVWMSLAIMCSTAISQGIVQRIKDIDPLVATFWSGLTASACSLVGVLLLGTIHLFGDFSHSMRSLWLSSLGGGAIIVIMGVCNVLSYQKGASIALKKLVMNGFYLTTTMLFAALIFREGLTGSKLFGVGIYVVAFVLVDQKTWDFITRKNPEPQPTAG